MEKLIKDIKVSDIVAIAKFTRHDVDFGFYRVERIEDTIMNDKFKHKSYILKSIKGDECIVMRANCLNKRFIKYRGDRMYADPKFGYEHMSYELTMKAYHIREIYENFLNKQNGCNTGTY